MPGLYGEPAGPAPLDRAGEHRRTGHVGHHERRAKEPCTSAEERDGDPIAAVVPIDQHRHDPVLAQAAPDLQRRVERLADLDRVSADLITDLAADPVDRGVGLRHRDDGQRQREHAEENPAHLPVAEMAGHQDDAAALGPQIVEEAALGLGDVEQIGRLAVGA